MVKIGKRKGKKSSFLFLLYAPPAHQYGIYHLKFIRFNVIQNEN